MVADFSPGPPIEVGRPRILVEGDFDEPSPHGAAGYDLAPGGEVFAVVEKAPERKPKEIAVILNWFEELKRLAPTEHN